jgi:hypothetical protein
VEGGILPSGKNVGRKEGWRRIQVAGTIHVFSRRAGRPSSTAGKDARRYRE